MTNKECKQLLEKIKIGSKVLYRIHIDSDDLQEGCITSIEKCKHECKDFCPGLNFGINGSITQCMCYSTSVHKNKTLIVAVKDFIEEDEFRI